MENDGVLNIFDDDKPWLIRQPGMAPWEEGRQQLLDLLLDCVRRYSEEVQSLAAKRSLVADYDNERDGRRHIKDITFPEITETGKRLKAEFTEALQQYPERAIRLTPVPTISCGPRHPHSRHGYRGQSPDQRLRPVEPGDRTACHAIGMSFG